VVTQSTTPYVPILKTKQGELTALQELDAAVKEKMTPLLELTADENRPMPEHIARVHDRVTKAFTEGERFFFDFYQPQVDPLYPMRGATLVESVFEGFRTEGLNATPVTRLGASIVYQDKIREIARRDDLGVCVRICQDDFDMRTLRTRFRDVVAFLGVESFDLDVVVDLGSISVEQVQSMALAAEAVIASLPDVERFRSVTVVSSGFPKDLSICSRDAITRIPRSDWLLFETLRSSNTLKRKPAYGDYGIQYPTIGEFDPTRMRMSAAIRYTGESDYVVSKGRMIGGGNTWEQTTHLAAALIIQPEFRGASYSAGEAYIAGRASGSNPVGGAPVWRRVGTTQHLTLATRQYATATGS
jgi:hypothetical protein